MPKKHKYKFRLFSAVLATVCIILVGDAVAPTAAIGNSQYFWWIIMLLGFFVPYGLISAELGTQYPSEGGLYTWIKKAFGPKWAGRVAWFYWVNFPLWIASLADLVTTVIMQIAGIEMTWPLILGIQAFYIVLVSVLGSLRVSQSDILSNLGAICKFIFMAGLGALGIYVLITQGTANPIESWTDLLPMTADGHFSFAGLGFVSLIIFNMLGFEVVSTFSDDMDNPKKEIPKAIIVGGILIAIFYLLPSFGIGVAIPIEELQTNTGLLESYGVLLRIVGFSAGIVKAILTVVGGLFIYTLIANIASWNFGVNSVIAEAAADGTFPKSWAKRNKDGVPYVVSIWTGVVAMLIAVGGIIVAEFFPEVSNLFWTFFSLSLVCLLLCYLPMFLAFLKLHRRGPAVKSGYWISGGRVKIFLYAIIPFLLLLIALFFTLFPELNFEMFKYQWPLILGTCVAVLMGEILVNHSARKRSLALATRSSSRRVSSGRTRSTKSSAKSTKATKKSTTKRSRKA